MTTATPNTGTYPVLEAARAIVRYLTPSEKRTLRDELDSQITTPGVDSTGQALIDTLAELGPWEGDIAEDLHTVYATRSKVSS